MAYVFLNMFCVACIHQTICFQDGRCVAGAGAVEMELSKQVNEFGKTCEGLEQYSVQRFAKALQVSLLMLSYMVNMGIYLKTLCEPKSTRV